MRVSRAWLAEFHLSHFQLQVYTDAGRREGLLVEAAYVHDLKNATRRLVPVGEGDIAAAEDRVRTLVGGLRAKDYSARPSMEVCGRCDVSALCRHRADRPRATARRA